MRAIEDSGELQLSDYIAILRRRWIWVLIPLLLIPAFAYYRGSQQVDVYSATARVLLADSAAQEAIGGSFINTSSQSRQLNNEINLAESDISKDLVRRKLGLGDDEGLPGASITADDFSDVLSFTVSAGSGEEAAFYANTWAESYVELKQTDASDSITQTTAELEATLARLREERSEVRADLEDLEDRLVRADDTARESLQLQVDRETSAISGELNLIDAQIAANIQSITSLQLSGDLAAIGTARVFQEANPPSVPTNAPVSRNIVLGLVVGGILGVGLALLRDNLDQSVSSVEDLTNMGFTTLGAIPVPSKALRNAELSLVGLNQPDSAVADAYQKVRTALQFASMGSEIQSIVVTSPHQGDGKTTTSVNIAVAFANVDQRVVLVDTDLRRPRIHAVFNTALTPGITDALIDEIPLNEIAVRSSNSPDTLAALPAGTQPPNPSTFLSSPTFARFAKDIEVGSDLVVYDAPPVLAVADALSVSQHTDGVVLVAAAGRSKRDDLKLAANNIEQAGGRVIGVVLIGVKDSGRYGQYYADVKSTDQPRSARLAEPASVNGSNKSSSKPVVNGIAGKKPQVAKGRRK